MAKTIQVQVKVMEDQDCIVKNYRRKPAEWENGTVHDVSIKIKRDGSYRVTYRVRLERRSASRSKVYPIGGAPIFIHVGDDAIESHFTKNKPSASQTH